MLNTVDTIVDRVDDPKSVMMVVDATGSVSSNPDQMPTSNQEKGSFIFEKVGEKAKNFSSEDGGMVVDLTASILGAGSNLFDAAVNTLPVMDTMNRSNMSIFVRIISLALFRQRVEINCFQFSLSLSTTPWSRKSSCQLNTRHQHNTTKKRRLEISRKICLSRTRL